MQFEEGMKKIQAMAGHSQEQLDEIRQGILNLASSETIWVMNSKRCCRCGALLDYFECILCTDCLEKAMYDAEQERYAVYDDEDEQPTIGTPEEAYAVELSLSDGEIERLLADED